MKWEAFFISSLTHHPLLSGEIQRNENKFLRRLITGNVDMYSSGHSGHIFSVIIRSTFMSFAMQNSHMIDDDCFKLVLLDGPLTIEPMKYLAILKVISQ